MPLTKTERLILANQYKILDALQAGDGGPHKTLIAALKHGYAAYYEQALDQIYDELSPEDASLVNTAMAMYDALQRAHAAHGSATGVPEERVAFPGFDGNNETALMAYARFVVEHEQRFDYLKLGRDRFNSHAPMRARYAAMIQRWKELDESYHLTPDQVRAILA